MYGMSNKLNTPPQLVFQVDNYQPDVRAFLIELRTEILHISIDQLVTIFQWNNEKYYQQIVNGYKDKNGVRKYKNPTINYLFGALNYAMSTNQLFISHQKAIEKLIKKHLLKY